MKFHYSISASSALFIDLHLSLCSTSIVLKEDTLNIEDINTIEMNFSFNNLLIRTILQFVIEFYVSMNVRINTSVFLKTTLKLIVSLLSKLFKISSNIN